MWHFAELNAKRFPAKRLNYEYERQGTAITLKYQWEIFFYLHKALRSARHNRITLANRPKRASFAFIPTWRISVFLLWFAGAITLERAVGPQPYAKRGDKNDNNRNDNAHTGIFFVFVPRIMKWVSIFSGFGSGFDTVVVFEVPDNQMMTLDSTQIGFYFAPFV